MSFPVSVELELLFSSVVVTVVGGNATIGAGCCMITGGDECTITGGDEVGT